MATLHDKTWPELAWKSWMLMGEMATVIWLRSIRTSMGGPVAAREMQRMVSEKVASGIAFWPKVVSKGATQTPEAFLDTFLDHYEKPVRANRRRLSEGSR